MITDYEKFLESKQFKAVDCGKKIELSDVHPKLFEWQKKIVQWAVRKGRCAIFLDTGLGKTFCQLEYARLIGENTLIVAPLSVARQTVREAKKIDLEVRYVRDKSEITPDHKLWITNYEMVDSFDYSIFGNVILDECFAPDTLIDVFSIDMSLAKRYIKDIKVGDKIYNATGEDAVGAIYKRRINRAIQITINGNAITSSENHPYFTMHGWRCAQDLLPGDYIMETATAMRMVREDVYPQKLRAKDAKVLRSILLSELAHDATGDNSQGSYKRNSCQNRGKEKSLVSIGKSNCDKRTGENHCVESINRPQGKSENIIEVASDGSQTFRAWGKWSRNDITSAINEGCIVRELDTGICYITGSTSSRFSNMLQGRLRESRVKNSDRGGWLHSSLTEINRPEEGCKAGFSRVESVKILEQGCPELDKYREADGNIYFYDIKAKQHPSYSINGLLVHNSSILKSIQGHTRQLLTELCRNIPYRLCCTATPAPNDWPELGNHTELLGICRLSEMLGMFFINANKEFTFDYGGKTYHRKGTNKGGTEWRLKHHAEQPFFKWLSTWAITMVKPSDLGYEDDGFILPPLNIKPVFIHTDYKPKDQLFFTHLHGIANRVEVRRDTLEDKLDKLKEILATDNDQWIIWCGLDSESHAIKKLLGDGCTEVKGSDSIEYKVSSIEGFQDGKINTLLTKGKIAGYGLNLQCAHNMIFFGISDSWELLYQCIRRQWRYGQKKPVNVYFLIHEAEDEIYQNLLRKEAMATRLRNSLIEHIRDYEKEELGMTVKLTTEYKENTIKGDNWTAMLGDACQRLAEIGDNSIDFSIYSPAFVDLFTYSPTERDLGNSRSWSEFFEHYGFIIREILRVTKPGRLSCVHTSDIAAMAQKDGYIGLKDFPGEVIRAHQKEGWVFVGRAFVQKNPQAQAIRIKSKALLFVQIRKDSSDSRPALIDQVLIFKKPGENAIAVTPVNNGELDNETWIEWANGIWLGIRETDTLQFTSAKSAEDEKHVCPLQLGTIERCIKLYSNPGDTVLSPFMGIGSEIYQALRFGRRGIGIELKEEYYQLALKNLRKAESENRSRMLL